MSISNVTRKISHGHHPTVALDQSVVKGDQVDPCEHGNDDRNTDYEKRFDLNVHGALPPQAWTFLSRSTDPRDAR
jgi:hypothetical protein